MISDQERREVAATMMAISCRGVKDLTLGEVLNSILTGGAPRPTTEMAILSRLADLIDRPTCRNIGDDCMFKCSECGAEFEPVTVNGNEYGEVFYTPLKPLYCSACGAEVVHE